MAEIFQNDFSAGWRPSDSELNGAVNALLRMQNVKLDEGGALTLIPGSSKVFGSSTIGDPIAVFSKVINSVLYRFYSGTDGKLYVSIANAAPVLLNSNYSASRVAFNACFNQVIICGGGASQQNKYIPSNSTIAVSQMGWPAPAAATVAVNNPYTKDVTGTIGSYTALSGTVSTSGSYVKIAPDATLLSGSAYLSIGSAVDSTNLSSSSLGLDTDLFTIEIKVDDPTQLLKVDVIFKDYTDATNYFQYTFGGGKATIQGKTFIRASQNPWALNIPPGQAVKLICNRGDFEINGRPLWTNIGYVVVQIQCINTVTNFYFDNLTFSGGTKGTLVGNIEYLTRYKSNLSTYQSVSDISVAATVVNCQSASTHITPPALTSADQSGTLIYRRGGGLADFYLIKDQTGVAVAFDDTLSDQDAILAGVILDLNEKVIYSLTDSIQEIVGPFFNRWIYFSNSKIYISKDGNPEIYSQATGILTPYGTSSETFLWAHKFGNSAILVGTTNDIYEITGTLTELPDGTIDATVRPTGCQNPPINTACAATANELYYISSDGVRQANPSGYALVGMNELDLLFKGKNRYSYVAPQIRGGNQDKHILAVSKNELYWSFTDTNGLRKMLSYDLLRKYWYEFKSNTGGYGGPVCMFTEEDGSLLAGYRDTSDNYGRILNSGTLIDGTTNPEVFLRFKFFNGQLPRNRKDSLTLKLKINTGSNGIEVKIYKDESSTSTSLGFINTASLQEVAIDLSTVIGVCNSYSLEISGNCSAFKLTDWSIDFIERPQSLSYFRSTPENYGSQGRKKIYQIPFTIDTNGSEVSFTPYLDGVAQLTQKFNTGSNGKQTLEYIFFQVGVARDVFFKILLTTGVQLFEYYGSVAPKVIEILPDRIITYTIPDTNFETFSRKRFIAFAIVVDSNGSNFYFIPYIDGVAQTPKVFNSFGKQTVVYYFDSETIGIDIGAVINCGTGMEFYGINLQECVSEKLPPSSTFIKLSSNNFGVANKKRIRTVPLVIDTKGHDVTYTPKVDGNTYPTATFNTSEKRTVLYYFESDAFGIDLSGSISGSSNFEFYGILNPDTVEILPVAKKFDQLGPVEFKRSGNIRGMRVRLISNTVGINYTVYVDDIARVSDSFSTTINVDKTYEIPWLRKFLNGTTCRIELTATSAFHRISSELKVSESGAAGSGRWVKIP